MLQKILAIVSSRRFKGAVAVIAAVVMYFTPDNIDNIIISILGVLGISHLVIVPDGDKPSE
ncbi:MAG: hypothetical protein LBQ08_05070 [Holosporaceae bacterium]|jgi:hypothetical protein|nr:hypothetical protein [Holosporaceae bacterium]